MKLSFPIVLTLALSTLMVGCSNAQKPATAFQRDAERHFKRGEFAEAVDNYQNVVNRFPGNWEAQYFLGVCHLELNRTYEARQALEIAHTLRPANDEVAAALAEAIFRDGDENQLYSFLRERAQSKQDVTSYLRLAHYSIEMGDPDSARKAIETAILLDNGESVLPYLQAASFSERIGDLEQAVTRLRQAYGIDPLDEAVKNRLRDLGEIPGPTLALPPGI
ncbi:MAG: tetratricopeptide repeat protein [Planctomycetota bacterium]|nr:tetratricopeptide repeat protein [Planctomycetota bacterium]